MLEVWILHYMLWILYIWYQFFFQPFMQNHKASFLSKFKCEKYEYPLLLINANFISFLPGSHQRLSWVYVRETLVWKTSVQNYISYLCTYYFEMQLWWLKYLKYTLFFSFLKYIRHFLWFFWIYFTTMMCVKHKIEPIL